MRHRGGSLIIWLIVGCTVLHQLFFSVIVMGSRKLAFNRQDASLLISTWCTLAEDVLQSITAHTISALRLCVFYFFPYIVWFLFCLSSSLFPAVCHQFPVTVWVISALFLSPVCVFSVHWARQRGDWRTALHVRIWQSFFLVNSFSFLFSWELLGMLTATDLFPLMSTWCIALKHTGTPSFILFRCSSNVYLLFLCLTPAYCLNTLGWMCTTRD